MNSLVAAGLFALLLSAPVDPQGAAPVPSTAPASPATTAAPSPPPDSGPVAVPEPTEKAMRYYRTGNVVWVVGQPPRPDRRELLFVMGHEMGHYVLGHIPKSIAFFSLVILLTLYVAHRTAGRLLSRFRARFRFDSLADVAALPLLMLLANAFSLVVTPPLMAFSRYQEHQADQFGLEITHDNHAAATAFVKLPVENLGNPRPGLLYKLWRSSHPPVGERIDFCNTYRPWEEGKPGKFEHLFATPRAATPRVSSSPVTRGVPRQSPLATPPAVSSPQSLNRSNP
jgi:hypothetical protein